ncbi:MAG: peptidoglycan-binding protein, partial [Blastocatellia bacterium]|nr:peptidoglycan-binding protein [Blastocatellia bacterium]
MNNRPEFDLEAFGSQPFSYEDEEEIRQRGILTTRQRRTARGGRKAAASRRLAAALKSQAMRGRRNRPRHAPKERAGQRAGLGSGQLHRRDDGSGRGRRFRPRFPRGSYIWPGLQVDQTGDNSEYVRWVQASLNQALNLNLPLTGVMDDETRNAIRSFQQREGLPVTGVVGPDTQQSLLAAGKNASPAASEPPPAAAAPAGGDTGQ